MNCAERLGCWRAPSAHRMRHVYSFTTSSLRLNSRLSSKLAFTSYRLFLRTTLMVMPEIINQNLCSSICLIRWTPASRNPVQVNV